MMCVDQKTSLLDEFSRQVQRHLPAGLWSSPFPDRTGTPQFDTRTLLGIACPQNGPITRDGVVTAANRLARLHGGCVDSSVEEFVVISFPTAVAGLRMAMALQRATARARLRMGIVIGRCEVVRAHANGRENVVLLGNERASVQELAAAAPAGTVQMSPDAYEAVRGSIDEALGSCLVMTEYEGDELRDVTLTVPPDRSVEFSTFAGLGLT